MSVKRLKLPLTFVTILVIILIISTSSKPIGNGVDAVQLNVPSYTQTINTQACAIFVPPSTSSSSAAAENVVLTASITSSGNNTFISIYSGIGSPSSGSSAQNATLLTMVNLNMTIQSPLTPIEMSCEIRSSSDLKYVFVSFTNQALVGVNNNRFFYLKKTNDTSNNTTSNYDVIWSLNSTSTLQYGGAFATNSDATILLISSRSNAFLNSSSIQQYYLNTTSETYVLNGTILAPILNDSTSAAWPGFIVMQDDGSKFVVSNLGEPVLYSYEFNTTSSSLSDPQTTGISYYFADRMTIKIRNMTTVVPEPFGSIAISGNGLKLFATFNLSTPYEVSGIYTWEYSETSQIWSPNATLISFYNDPYGNGTDANFTRLVNAPVTTNYDGSVFAAPTIEVILNATIAALGNNVTFTVFNSSTISNEYNNMIVPPPPTDQWLVTPIFNDTTYIPSVVQHKIGFSMIGGFSNSMSSDGSLLATVVIQYADPLDVPVSQWVGVYSGISSPTPAPTPQEPDEWTGPVIVGYVVTCALVFGILLFLIVMFAYIT